MNRWDDLYDGSIKCMIGVTFDSVKNISNEELIFSVGNRWIKFFHIEDCCEHVYIEDICGDLNDLVGSPIVIAEEVNNIEEPVFKDYTPESYTWTFYRFATVKGTVTVRWLGESNGYYSEGVNVSRKGEWE